MPLQSTASRKPPSCKRAQHSCFHRSTSPRTTSSRAGLPACTASKSPSYWRCSAVLSTAHERGVTVTLKVYPHTALARLSRPTSGMHTYNGHTLVYPHTALTRLSRPTSGSTVLLPPRMVAPGKRAPPQPREQIEVSLSAIASGLSSSSSSSSSSSDAMWLEATVVRLGSTTIDVIMEASTITLVLKHEGRTWRRETVDRWEPTVGAPLFVECDDWGDGESVTWRPAVVRTLHETGAFSVVVDGDEGHKETLDLAKEGDEWVRASSSYARKKRVTIKFADASSIRPAPPQTPGDFLSGLQPGHPLEAFRQNTWSGCQGLK